MAASEHYYALTNTTRVEEFDFERFESFHSSAEERLSEFIRISTRFRWNLIGKSRIPYSGKMISRFDTRKIFFFLHLFLLLKNTRKHVQIVKLFLLLLFFDSQILPSEKVRKIIINSNIFLRCIFMSLKIKSEAQTSILHRSDAVY